MVRQQLKKLFLEVQEGSGERPPNLHKGLL